MFKNLASASVVSLAAILAALAASPSTAQTRPPLKIGFVYVSPVGEAGCVNPDARITALLLNHFNFADGCNDAGEHKSFNLFQIHGIQC